MVEWVDGIPFDVSKEAVASGLSMGCWEEGKGCCRMSVHHKSKHAKKMGQLLMFELARG
jgi:hypothetical protein